MGRSCELVMDQIAKLGKRCFLPNLRLRIMIESFLAIGHDIEKYSATVALAEGFQAFLVRVFYVSWAHIRVIEYVALEMPLITITVRLLWCFLIEESFRDFISQSISVSEYFVKIGFNDSGIFLKLLHESRRAEFIIPPFLLLFLLLFFLRILKLPSSNIFEDF